MSLPLGLHGFWCKICCHVNCCSSQIRCHSSCCFQGLFSLPLVFRNLCLGVDFFEFIFFEVCLASWICMFYIFCQIWKNFVIISSNTFKPYSLYFLLRTLMPWILDIRSFVIVPQVPEAQFIFFMAFFSVLLRLGILYSVFQFTDSFLFSTGCWTRLLNFFFLISVFVFFSSEIPIWSSSVSLLRFLFPPFVPSMFVIAWWSILMMAALKCLLGSNTCVISMAVSVGCPLTLWEGVCSVCVPIDAARLLTSPSPGPGHMRQRENLRISRLCCSSDPTVPSQSGSSLPLFSV